MFFWDKYTRACRSSLHLLWFSVGLCPRNVRRVPESFISLAPGKRKPGFRVAWELFVSVVSSLWLLISSPPLAPYVDTWGAKIDSKKVSLGKVDPNFLSAARAGFFQSTPKTLCWPSHPLYFFYPNLWALLALLCFALLRSASLCFALLRSASLCFARFFPSWFCTRLRIVESGFGFFRQKKKYIYSIYMCVVPLIVVLACVSCYFADLFEIPFDCSR